MTKQATAPAMSGGVPERVGLRSSFLGWSRLDAYIFGEIHFPFFMALLFYNGIFFINTFSRIGDLSGGRFELPLPLILFYFASELPETLYLTSALSFLFAALAAVGRMSADSEIIAPFTTGISPWRLSRPVIVYGALVSMVLFFAMNVARPWLNGVWLYKYRNFIENVALPSIEPGTITPLGGNAVIYVAGVAQGKLADLIFINQSSGGEDILLAKRASIYRSRDMTLFDYININLPLEGDKGPEILWAEEMSRSLPLPRDFSGRSLRGKPRELLQTDQLYRVYRATKGADPELGNELFRRLFSPLVCLIFSLYAIPLAARHSRFKPGSGFGLSLLIMAGYFIAAKLGRDASSQGKIAPLLGVGLSPLFFFALGLLLQIGKNRWWSRYFERGKQMLGTAWHYLRHQFSRLMKIREKARRREKRPSGSAVTLLFPSKLDSYIIKSFLSIYLMVQCSVLIIFYLVEYTGISKWVFRQGVGMDVVIRYMLAKTPEIFDLSMFICLLISTLILLAVMSKNQEVTVVRASGGSLQRLCLPLLFCGFLASGLSFYMQNAILPQINRIAVSLKNKIKDKRETLFSRDVWLKTAPGEMLNYRFYDQRSNRLVGVRHYKTGNGEAEYIERIDIPSLRYSGSWVSEKVGSSWLFQREADGGVSAIPTVIEEETPFVLHIDPEDLMQKKRRVSEFSIQELREYLKYLKSLGFSESHYQTELYAKYAYPLIPSVMMLLAMPLGFHFGRRGAFYGVGAGLVAGLSFWMLFEFMKRMGALGLIHPLAAAWTAIVIFGFFALYRFIYLE